MIDFLIMLIFVFLFLSPMLAWLLYITLIDDYRDLKVYKKAPKIKFNSFKSLYYVNPSKWTLKEYYVRYSIEAKEYYQRYQDVTFSYFQWRKYRRFLIHLSKEKEKEQIKELEKLNSENLLFVLADIKSDIMKMEFLANKQIKEAYEISSKIKL